MYNEKIERYVGIVAELAEEFDLSRPTITKYLDKYYDKKICVDVRTRAISKFRQHIAAEKNGMSELAEAQNIQLVVPVYYLRGGKKLGLFSGFLNPRMHEQWRKEGLPYCRDGAGNFLYRTDNVARFIETKYAPTQISSNR